jgi:PAS domain-containing protein
MRDVNPLDLLETTRDGILVLEPDLTIRFASRSFYDTFAVASAQTVGRKVYEIGNARWDIPQFRTSLETIISGRKTIKAFEVGHFFRSIGRRTVMLNARRVYRPHNKIPQILTGWLQSPPDDRSKR